MRLGERLFCEMRNLGFVDCMGLPGFGPVAETGSILPFFACTCKGGRVVDRSSCEVLYNAEVGFLRRD
jgi:hypothetical protein